MGGRELELFLRVINQGGKAGPAEAVQSWSDNNIGSCVEGGNSLGGGGGGPGACSPGKF